MRESQNISVRPPEPASLVGTGAPDENSANILLLNQWPIDTGIETILAVQENRYRFMEGRRDDRVYWLHAEFVAGYFAHSYMVGDKGISTDHERLPMIKGRSKQLTKLLAKRSQEASVCRPRITTRCSRL